MQKIMRMIIIIYDFCIGILYELTFTKKQKKEKTFKNAA